MNDWNKYIYGIKIERDEDVLINMNYMGKIVNNWDHLHYKLELKASDDNYIFSFFGKNGIGKTTICKSLSELSIAKNPYSEEFKNTKVMRIKDEINFEFNSVYPFFLKEEGISFFFYDYFNEKKIGIIQSININDSAEEFSRTDYIKKNLNIIIKIINNWADKKSINIHNYKNRGKSGLFILVEALEKKLIQEKNNLSDFFNGSISNIGNITNKNDILNIFYDEIESKKIKKFLMECFIKLEKLRCLIKIRNDENNKIIHELNLVENRFNILTDDFSNGIEIQKKYNSFSECEYQEILILNKKNSPIKLHVFLREFTSEGQNKLIKLFLLCCKIKALAKKETIIIADDIFDSFDNKNMIHIVSLINDSISKEKPVFVSFTHDFEIFRIINEDLKVTRENAYLLLRNNVNISAENLYISKGSLEEYIQEDLKNKDSDELNTLRFLICAAYIRDDIKRILGHEDDCYKKITNLLHIKDESLKTLQDLSPFFKVFFFLKFTKHRTKIEKYAKKHINYYDLLDSIFKYISLNKVKELEKNIFLAIYARILIERKILDELLLKHSCTEKEILEGIKINQTNGLIEYYLSKTTKNIPDSIILLYEYLKKFIHISRGLSYLINIDNVMLLRLIENVQVESFE